MPQLHPWDLEPGQAIKVQAKLQERLVLAWDGREITTVGGVDVSVKGNLARAAIVVLRYPQITPLEGATAETPVRFPYIPGLLAFREGPVVLAAWEQLQSKPDLLMFDGQGIAHPRGMGIAAHMGLWLERPSIGVAKSRLYGRHDDVGRTRGEGAELRDPRHAGNVIGVVLRTRTDVKPVYVSPGHMMDVPQAAAYTLGCCTRYRLPEPTRWAHRVAGGEKLPSETGRQPRLF
jgi:deoxyribonuclease V